MLLWLPFIPLGLVEGSSEFTKLVVYSWRLQEGLPGRPPFHTSELLNQTSSFIHEILQGRDTPGGLEKALEREDELVDTPFAWKYFLLDSAARRVAPGGVSDDADAEAHNSGAAASKGKTKGDAEIREGAVVVDFAIVQCRHDLDWLSQLPLEHIEPRVFVYQKCEKTPRVPLPHTIVRVRDPGRQEDECSGYIEHILSEDPGHFTFFLHDDVDLHVDVEYLRAVLRRLAEGARLKKQYLQAEKDSWNATAAASHFLRVPDFLPLSQMRLMPYSVPCMEVLCKAVEEAPGRINTRFLTGYASNHFMVSASLVRAARDRALRLRRAMRSKDVEEVCTREPFNVWWRTKCAMMEYIWPVIFARWGAAGDGGSPGPIGRVPPRLNLPDWELSSELRVKDSAYTTQFRWDLPPLASFYTEEDEF